MQLFQYLSIAALAHLLIWYITPSERQSMRSSQPIEVNFIESQQENQPKYLVEANPLSTDTSLDRLKKATNKLSSVTQRVRREQALQGRNPINQQPKAQPAPQQRQAWEPPPLNGAGDMARQELKDTQAKEQRVTRQEKRWTMNVGSKVMKRFLPEVKSGTFTSLNTDQFLFYTFHARTSQQIGNRWTENLRHYLNGITGSQYDQIANRLHITEFDAVMTPQGKFVKAIYHRKSKSPELDEAAVLSIVRASPFINPPEEMVQDDGFIYLKYRFEARLRPRSLASQ